MKVRAILAMDARERMFPALDDATAAASDGTGAAWETELASAAIELMDVTLAVLVERDVASGMNLPGVKTFPKKLSSCSGR